MKACVLKLRQRTCLFSDIETFQERGFRDLCYQRIVNYLIQQQKKSIIPVQTCQKLLKCFEKLSRLRKH